MKGALVLGVLLLSALAVSPFVHSSNAPDRPPGVSKELWIPIGDRVGFVVVPPPKEAVRGSPQALLLAPPVSGYFMLKGASEWRRIAIVEPPRGPGDAG